MKASRSDCYEYLASLVFVMSLVKGYHSFEDVPVAEFMYLVFTCMPGESYRRQLRSLLCSCDIF